MEDRIERKRIKRINQMLKDVVLTTMQIHHLEEDTFYVPDLPQDRINLHCRRHEIMIDYIHRFNTPDGKSRIRLNITLEDAY